jgi:hypothetical protein
VVSVLYISSKVRGFKPGRGRWICNGEKFLRRGIKPSVPCRKTLWHVKESYWYESRYLLSKIHDHFSPSVSCFATRCSASYCDTALVDESGMIRTQMGTHSISVMIIVLGTPCAISLRNSDSEIYSWVIPEAVAKRKIVAAIRNRNMVI